MSSRNFDSAEEVLFNTAKSTCKGDYYGTGNSSYGIHQTVCNGTGTSYVRDSGISISLGAVYSVSQWYIKPKAAQYFTDFCSYNSNDSVSSYSGTKAYCNNLTAGIPITKTFASGSTANKKSATEGKFLEAKILGLTISYSDGSYSGLDSESRVTSESNVTSNKTFTATDLAGNTASCTYNYSNSTCSCTEGSCSVN